MAVKRWGGSWNFLSTPKAAATGCCKYCHIHPSVKYQLLTRLTVRVANTVMGFSLVCWSAVTIGTGFIKNYHQAIAVRLLLGLFEAGLVPSLTFLISTIYSRNQQAKRVAVIYGASALSGAFGGLIAYGIQVPHSIQLKIFKLIYCRAVDGSPTRTRGMALAFHYRRRHLYCCVWSCVVFSSKECRDCVVFDTRGTSHDESSKSPRYRLQRR